MRPGQEGPPTFPRGVWTGEDVQQTQVTGLASPSSARKGRQPLGTESPFTLLQPRGCKNRNEDGGQGGGRCRDAATPELVKAVTTSVGGQPRGHCHTWSLITPPSAHTEFFILLFLSPFPSPTVSPNQVCCCFSSRFPIFFFPWTPVESTLIRTQPGMN